MGLLKLKQIVKHFSPSWYLDVESLHVEPGKVYAVYGPNGSGKTTLLNVMALLMKPDAGQVHLNGIGIDFSARRLFEYRRRVSLVMQKGLLFKGSARENIEYGLRCRKTLGQKEKKRVGDVAELMGVDPFLDRDVRTLSGGERQRVMLARVLVLDVDLLLLDEVMTGVDTEYRAIVESVLRSYVERGDKAVVMTTHDLFQAHSLADEVFYMTDGKVTV